MTYPDTVKSCPKCNHTLDGDFIGIPKEYDVAVTGSSNYVQDVQALKTTPFEKLKVSRFEVQRAIKWIISGIIVAPFLMIFGSWVIANFTGPGVLFFGYGAVIAGPVSFLFFISTGLDIILGDPRGKTPAKAFQKIWRDALFDAGSASMSDQYTGSKKSGYLYRRYLRSVHPLHRNATEQEVIEYIDGLRKIARTYFDDITASMDLSCKNSTGSDFLGQWDNYCHFDSSCKIISENSQSATVEGKICISFDKTCKISDRETYSLPAAVVNFNVKQQYVKCGDFWAPADPMPVVSIKACFTST
jgi:hypothetical protein